MAGAESTRELAAVSPRDGSRIYSGGRLALRRRALEKALHYNELLLERLRARLDETPVSNEASAPPNGTPAPARLHTTLGPRPADSALHTANGASAGEWVPRPAHPPVAKPSESRWVPPNLSLPEAEEPDLGDAMQMSSFEDGFDAPRTGIFARLRVAIGRMPKALGSLPGRLARLARQAPIANAVVALFLLGSVGALILTSTHRPPAHVTARPAPLFAVPVASLPVHRHRRHRHRHVRLPAITVPASLEAPASPPAAAAPASSASLEAPAPSPGVP